MNTEGTYQQDTVDAPDGSFPVEIDVSGALPRCDKCGGMKFHVETGDRSGRVAGGWLCTSCPDKLDIPPGDWITWVRITEFDRGRDE